jgi:hypothetical protein
MLLGLGGTCVYAAVVEDLNRCAKLDIPDITAV